MATEQPSEPGTSVQWQVSAPAGPKPAGASKGGSKLARILVGALVIFVVMSVLYGLNNTIMVAGLLVICTAGLGLIPIVIGSWLVGWLVFAIWDAIQAQRRRPAVPSGTPGK
jgi:protein-S-isoprenylcysteine O-methyltransferase Ste14